MKPEPASTVCVAPEIRSKKVLIAVCIVLVFNELPVALISRILSANRVQSNKTQNAYRPIKCEMRQLRNQNLCDNSNYWKHIGFRSNRGQSSSYLFLQYEIRKYYKYSKFNSATKVKQMWVFGQCDLFPCQIINLLYP